MKAWQLDAMVERDRELEWERLNAENPNKKAIDEAEQARKILETAIDQLGWAADDATGVLEIRLRSIIDDIDKLSSALFKEIMEAM